MPSWDDGIEQDPLHHLPWRQTRLFRRRHESAVGGEAGIGVDLQDAGLARGVEPEVDPRVAAQAEDPPGGAGELPGALEQWRVRGVFRKAADRVDVGDESSCHFAS